MAKNHSDIFLCCKVFLGGVPWDITESALFTAFKMYGPIRIEWPGKDNSTIPKGYLYVIFENDKQVKNTGDSCYPYRPGCLQCLSWDSRDTGNVSPY